MNDFVFHWIWLLFGLLTAITFLSFSRQFVTSPHRFHIAFMALSYTALVIRIVSHNVMYDGSEVSISTRFFDLVIILLGVLGMTTYWKKEN